MCLTVRWKKIERSNEVWQKTLDALGKSQNTNSTSQNTSGNNAEILSNTNAATNSNAENSTENVRKFRPKFCGESEKSSPKSKKRKSKSRKNAAELLTLQTRISEQETRVNDTLASIKEVRDEALTNLFVQDSPAIWNVQRRADSAETLFQETESLWRRKFATLSEYSGGKAGDLFCT